MNVLIETKKTIENLEWKKLQEKEQKEENRQSNKEHYKVIFPNFQ